MSTRIAYIEKLTRIASKEKGMRRAFLLARVREAEDEGDEQFCRKMRVTEMADSAERDSNGRILSRDSNGRALSNGHALSGDSNEGAPSNGHALSGDYNERAVSNGHALSGDPNERVLPRRVPAGDRMMR
jgi:hypothetical protein